MIIAPVMAVLSIAFGAPGSFFDTYDGSAETIARLDPARIAGSICGGKMRGERARQAWMTRASLAVAAAASPTPGPVRLLEGLGDPGFGITTKSADARRFFGQGLMLTYGFNHGEAIRSFREAQRLDPDCAICLWGEAFALGPNINAPMDATANARAV